MRGERAYQLRYIPKIFYSFTDRICSRCGSVTSRFQLAPGKLFIAARSFASLTTCDIPVPNRRACEVSAHTNCATSRKYSIVLLTGFVLAVARSPRGSNLPPASCSLPLGRSLRSLPATTRSQTAELAR